MNKSTFKKKTNKLYELHKQIYDLKSEINKALIDLEFYDFHITDETGKNGLLLTYETHQYPLCDKVIDYIFSAKDEDELLKKLQNDRSLTTL